MKINHIINETTTAGSVATVSTPLGSTQSRGNSSIYGGKKVGTLLKGKKTNKPYANSLNEAAMKDLAYDLENMKPAEFQKKYGKTREEVKASMSRQPKPAQAPVNETDLQEDDVILIPGQGRKSKTGFVPHGQSRVDHEVEMARSDLFSAAKNAQQVYAMIKEVSEDEGLEGWVQEKIIKANDYLNTIREYLEGKQVQGVNENNQRGDSLVTDALKLMRGAEVGDAVKALKTVLGDREYNSRRGFYNFYIRQMIDAYGQQGVAEADMNRRGFLKGLGAAAIAGAGLGAMGSAQAGGATADYMQTYSKAKSKFEAGYDIGQVARALGVSGPNNNMIGPMGGEWGAINKAAQEMGVRNQDAPVAPPTQSQPSAEKQNPVTAEYQRLSIMALRFSLTNPKFEQEYAPIEARRNHTMDTLINGTSGRLSANPAIAQRQRIAIAQYMDDANSEYIQKTTALLKQYGALKEQVVAEELSMSHQRDHKTQKYPDNSNSLAKRSFSQAERPNVTKTTDGHPTVKYRTDSTGKAGQTRVEPTITQTRVKRKDSDKPIPSFLQKNEK